MKASLFLCVLPQKESQILTRTRIYIWLQTTMDWNWYLDFAEKHNFNYLRNRPKFDLSTFNQDYFNRMRKRFTEVVNRGIYISGKYRFPFRHLTLPDSFPAGYSWRRCCLSPEHSRRLSCIWAACSPHTPLPALHLKWRGN